MAADKEIIAQIEKIEAEAPGVVLAALDQHLGNDHLPGDRAEDGTPITHTGLAEALGQWVLSLKARAALWERSGAKGAKGRAADLLLVAGEVAALANALRAGPASPPAADPFATPAPPPPNGRPLTDQSGLDALIADSVAQHRGEVTHPFTTVEEAVEDYQHRGGEVTNGRISEQGECCENMLAEDEDPAPWCDCTGQEDGGSHAGPCKKLAHLRADHPPWLPPSGEVAAYLAGVIDELPGPPLGPSTVTNTDAWAYDQRPTEEKRMDAAQGVPVLGQAGSNANDYDTRYVPPGATPLTFADLLAPVMAPALPPHLSNSQINTVGDCAAKYRMQRVAALPQIPQWANIGGGTLHAAIEAFEHTVGKLGVPWTSDMTESYDTEVTWKHHFEDEIARVAATSPVPEVRWRSSRKGAEGRTWWEVNGPLMLRRYLDARPAEPTALLANSFSLPQGIVPLLVPAIECEITADIPTPYGPIPFVAKIDRITVDPSTGTLTIRDYKSSYERPTDITQLGEYAWALRFGSRVPEHVKIMGTYFDARRGEWTEPVDLAEAYPFEAFQYRLTVAHAQKLALTTGPTAARPSSYCGGCSVRYACPVMALKR